MSHFSMLVLVDHPVDRGAGAEVAVEPLLAAYDGNREVENHEVECYCVSVTAHDEAAQQAAEKVDFENRREAMREEWPIVGRAWLDAHDGEAEHPPWDVDNWEFDTIRDPERRAAVRERYEDLRARWEALHDEYERVQSEHYRTHPERGKPKPNCEVCNGTGRCRTTENPQAFWDWYQVGGRWTGILDGTYDPAMDPANQRVCSHCRAHPGKRYWREETSTSESEGVETMAVREEDGVYTRPVPTTPEDPLAVEAPCNGCDGTGVATVGPTSWRDFDGDVVPLQVLLRGSLDDRERRVRGAEERYAQSGSGDVEELENALDPAVGAEWTGCFYGLVTPDGEWHAKDRMGRFGTSDDAMDDETWRAYLREVAIRTLDEYPEATAIVVDCHS